MVVGVEPLGHFHGGVVGVAARQHEGLRQRQSGRVEAVARGQGTQQRGGLQHLVVPGEVADGDEVEPGLALSVPVTFAQRAAGGAQVRLGGGAFQNDSRANLSSRCAPMRG